MTIKENSFLQLILSLTGICMVAAVSLTWVYNVTKEPIAKMQIEKNNAAKVAVLPGFNMENGVLVDEMINLDGFDDPFTVTFAYLDKELFGAAVTSYTTKAFSGRFDIIVGFDKEGNILNTEVLGHQETPGLGDKIDKKKGAFPKQFEGKNPIIQNLIVKKDGGDINAITAATISSRAFCDAVANASQALQIALQNIEITNNNDTIKEKEDNHE